MVTVRFCCCGSGLFAANDIFDCCSFLCYSQAALCCNSFNVSRSKQPKESSQIKKYRPFTTSRLSRFYSVLGGSIIISIIIYTIFDVSSSPQQQARLAEQNKLVVLIAVLELFTSVVVFLTTVFHMQKMSKRHVEIYTKIHRLDERLRYEFHVDLNFHKLKRKIIILTTAVTLIYVISISSTIIIQIATNDDDDSSGNSGDNNTKIPVMIIGAAAYVYMTGGPHFTGYVHMNLTEILKIRFRALQRILSEEYLLRLYPKESMSEQMKRIESAVDMIKDLHRLINDINRVYQWSLLTAQLHDFTLTTSQLYLIADSLISTKKDMHMFSYMLLCLLIPMYKIIMAPVYCDLCIREGQRCLRSIEQLDLWFPKNARIHSLVHEMMLWRRRNDQHFSTGLMPLDIRTMTMVTAAIFNYIFILIQFSITEDMGATIEQQKNVLKDWIQDLDAF